MIAKSGRGWTNKPPSVSRRQSRNILTEEPGSTKYTYVAETLIDFLELFLTHETKSIIIRHTNEEPKRVCELRSTMNPSSDRREWRKFREAEFDAFLGLRIHGGVYHSKRENRRTTWTTDTSIKRNISTATLSRQRFTQFLCYLRFYDKSTREERRSTDKLTPIRQIWDLFVVNCKKAFSPYKTVAVDEQLVGFRGRCSFKQYIN